MTANKTAHAGAARHTAASSGSSLRATAIAAGRKIARRVFARRGNRTEAHISEAELAALCALAYQLGLKAGNHS